MTSETGSDNGVTRLCSLSLSHLPPFSLYSPPPKLFLTSLFSVVAFRHLPSILLSMGAGLDSFEQTTTHFSFIVHFCAFGGADPGHETWEGWNSCLHIPAACICLCFLAHLSTYTCLTLVIITTYLTLPIIHPTCPSHYL